VKASRRESGEKKRALKGSPLYQLDPFVDSDVVVRVGGRLRQAQLEYGEKHPALLPKSHNKVHHQGVKSHTELFDKPATGLLEATEQ